MQRPPGRSRWAPARRAAPIISRPARPARHSAATGAHAIAVGTAALGSGSNAIAMGNGASATHSGTIALGTGAASTGINPSPSGAARPQPAATRLRSARARSPPPPIRLVRLARRRAAHHRCRVGRGADRRRHLRSAAEHRRGLGSQIAGLQTQVDDNRREARAGTALALATSGLHFDPRPGKASLAAASAATKACRGWRSAGLCGFGPMAFQCRRYRNPSGQRIWHGGGRIVDAELTSIERSFDTFAKMRAIARRRIPATRRAARNYLLF